MQFIDVVWQRPFNTSVFLAAIGLTFDVMASFDPSTISFTLLASEGEELGLAEGAVLEVRPDGEPLDTLFVVEKLNKSQVVDGVRVWGVEGRSYHALLEDDFVWPEAFPNAKPSGHAFQDASPGFIVKTLVTRSQQRGFMVSVDHSSFTGAETSDKVPWAVKIDRQYSTGASVLSVLQGLHEQGLADGRFVGTRLDLFNAGVLSRHIPIDTLCLFAGRDILDHSSASDATEFATDILLEGEEGATSVASHPAAFDTVGRRRARYVSVGGIGDPGTLSFLASSELALRTHVATEHGIGLDHTTYRPFIDVRPGDWVWVDLGMGLEPVELQVHQLSVSQDASSGRISVGVTVGDILDDADVKLKRRIDNITGAGGSGGLPGTTAPLRLPPGAPGSPAVSSAAYTDAAGAVNAQITVSWLPVTVNADGTPANDLAAYRVYGKPSSSPDAWQLLGSTTHPEAVVYYSPLPVGTQYDVKVVAVDSEGLVGADSPVTTITTANDDIPPPVPSLPIVSCRLGVVSVYWDGQAEGGVGMPPDLARVEVHQFSAPDAKPVRTGPGRTVVGTLLAVGALTVSGLPYHTTQFFRLVAVDRSGNESPFTDVVPVTVVPLVDTDIIAQVINAQHIVDGTMVASDKVIANTVTGRLIQALAIETGHIAANAVTTHKLDVGAVTAEKIALGVMSSQLLSDPSFEEPTPFNAESGHGWRTPDVGDVYKSDRVQRGFPARSGEGFAVMQTSSAVTLLSEPFKVDPASSYTVSLAAVMVTGAGTPSISARLLTGTSPDALVVDNGPIGLDDVPVPGANATLTFDNTGDLSRVLTDFGYGAVSSVALSTVRAVSGTYSLQATWPWARLTGVGLALTGLQPGSMYETSCWVYVPAGTPDVRLGIKDGVSGERVSEKGQWALARLVWQATAVEHIVTLTSTDTLAGQKIWIDRWYVSAWTSGADYGFIQSSVFMSTDPAATWGQLALRLTSVGGFAEVAVDDVAVLPVGRGAMELTSAGVRLFDAFGREVAAFVSNRSNYFTVTEGEEVVASVSADGGISARTLTVVGADRDGDGEVDSGLEIFGEEWLDIIDRQPKGMVAAGYAGNLAIDGIGLDWYGIGEISWVSRLDRRGIPRVYRLDWSGIPVRANKATAYAVKVAVSTDGSSPVKSTTATIQQVDYLAETSRFYLSSPLWRAGTYAAEEALVRAVVFIRAWTADTTVSLKVDTVPDVDFRHPARLLVTDLGRDLEDSWVTNPGGGILNGGGASPPPSTPSGPKTRKVETVYATQSATYRSDGSRRTDTPDMVQGYYSTNGDQQAVAIFPSSIKTMLTGASIEKIEVYLYANSWWYSSGGTGLLAVHGYGTLPGSSPSQTAAVSSPDWSTGGRWVTLPSSLYAGFANGTYKGFGVRKSGTTSGWYYGRFRGASSTSGRPAMRFTYVK